MYGVSAWCIMKYSKEWKVLLYHFMPKKTGREQNVQDIKLWYVQSFRDLLLLLLFIYSLIYLFVCLDVGHYLGYKPIL